VKKLFVLIIVLSIVVSIGCSKKRAARSELDQLAGVQGNERGEAGLKQAGKAVFYDDKKITEKKEKLSGELQENQKKIVRLMISEEPFLETSPDVKNAPETLNLFFNQNVYEKLRGNFIFGYHFDEGFTGSEKTFAVDAIKAGSDSKQYVTQFKRHLAETATKIGVRIDRDSSVRLSMYLVGVIPQMQEKPFSYPGLVAEVCLFNRETKKGYFVRFGLGKKEGLDRAMQEYSLMLMSLMDTRAT